MYSIPSQVKVTPLSQHTPPRPQRTKAPRLLKYPAQPVWFPFVKPATTARRGARAPVNAALFYFCRRADDFLRVWWPVQNISFDLHSILCVWLRVGLWSFCKLKVIKMVVGCTNMLKNSFRYTDCGRCGSWTDGCGSDRHSGEWGLGSGRRNVALCSATPRAVSKNRQKLAIGVS